MGSATRGTPPDKRDSNALRASVLDAALQLGFGTNGAVANWIYNDPIAEEQEEEAEETVISPGLTSASTASEDSHSPYTPTVFQSAGASPVLYTPPQPIPLPPSFSSSSATLTNKTPPPHNKLRKHKKGGDGYDSDGGYLSDVGTKSKDKKKEKKEKEKQRKKEKKSGGDGHGTDYESDGGYLSEVFSPSKRFRSKAKSKSKSHSRPASPTTGYETDGAKPKPKKPGFFRKSSKTLKPETDTEEIIPAVPPLPVPTLPVPTLPIADRFASRPTSPAEVMPSSSLDEDKSRSATPHDYFAPSPIPSAPHRAVHFEDSKGSVSSSSGGSLAISSPYTNPHLLSPSGSPHSPLSPGNYLAASSHAKHTPSPLSLSPARSPVPSPLPSSFIMVTPTSSSNARPPAFAQIQSVPTSPSSITPSSEYIVPSPMASPLPNHGHIHTQYDIPAPSPPPTGPLPPPPPPPSSSLLPPQSIPQSRAQSPIQRGREPPFPARPRDARPPGALDGFQARVRVERYRGLYAFPGALPEDRKPYVPGITIENAEEPGDDDKLDLGSVLAERFQAQGSDASSKFREEIETLPSVSVEDGGLRYADEYYAVGGVSESERYHAEKGRHQGGPRIATEQHWDEPSRPLRVDPLQAAHPYSALRPAEAKISHRAGVKDTSALFPADVDPRGTFYSVLDTDGEVDRYSRFTTASVYSRGSFMDEERSEETRERFVKRVQDVYGPNGREHDEVPPVPQVPVGFAGSGRF